VSQPTCPSADELSGFVLGTLPAADLGRIGRHLDGCPSCEAVVRGLENASDPLLVALRRSRAAPPPAAPVTDARPDVS
jgi:anti-sigma factor RsiW